MKMLNMIDESSRGNIFLFVFLLFGVFFTHSLFDF